MPPLDGCRCEDGALELGFVDRDGVVEPVLVDSQVRVKTVVLRVADRDDRLMRTDSVTARKQWLPISELDSRMRCDWSERNRSVITRS